jgi:DNA invertase Pin-like site-specific DNA recombinase
MVARRIGISYTRFSDPAKQSDGDSQDRQDRMFRDFCQRHTLTPLREVFADKGRSGYRDEHRKKGRLGQLVAMAKDGAFDPGTVIVIEAWDRLGRLRPDKQTDLIAELLRTGVSIGICRLDDIFAEEDFGTHKWTTLAVFIQLAYQESKQKADRIGESWQARRDRAREDGTPVTGRLPAWLEMVGGVPRPVPERVAALRRLFALAAGAPARKKGRDPLKGCGRSRIVAALTREKVPPFGNSGKWTRSYISRILSDERVLGVYQPRKTDDTPDGPAIRDYYPRVISDEEWALARAGQEQRQGRDKLGRALVRPERRRVNLFRDLLTHARDGERFYINLKVDGGKRSVVLVNSAGGAGRGKNYTFPYLVFEEAVLRLLREVRPEDVLPREGQGAGRADVLRAQLGNLHRDIAALQEDLDGGYSKALAAVLRKKEGEAETVAGQLQDELAKAARPAERAWRDFPQLADLVREGGDEARLRLRPVLRRIVENAVVLIVPRGSWQLLALQVYFHGGVVRDYLVVRQVAGFHRPGGWAARSLAEAGHAGGLDLRDRDHVAALEQWLQAVDVDRLRQLLRPGD